MYKLYEYKSKLSLGQRLGLFPCPAPPLNNQDWQKIEDMSKERDENVCAICLEEFKNLDQVILSCSHIFHKNCLSSFEKFSKEKTCPICRKESYEKKQYKYNQEKYRRVCVVRIQKHMRGYLGRKQFYEFMVKRPINTILHPRLKRRVLGYKLQMVSRR